MGSRMVYRTIISVMLAAVLVACSAPVSTPAVESQPDGKLDVVATTSIVGDVVKQIGGDQVDVQLLIPVGVDEHSFQPTPQDVAKIADADLIFMNGAGLEEFMAGLIENAGGGGDVVMVSDGIDLVNFGGEEMHADNEEDAHAEGDPHVWVDPNNVKVWVDNIAQALSTADPANQDRYAANAGSYLDQLEELDGWVREQVAQVPVENRKIITDHLLLGYFAERYGFELVGAVIPGYSTMAEPSAQEIAALENTIRDLGVKAVFVGESVSPQLARRIAEDTGTELVFFYTGSLSEPEGPAGTYIDYIRYNVNAIVSALK